MTTFSLKVYNDSDFPKVYNDSVSLRSTMTVFPLKAYNDNVSPKSI